ncbi:MAG: hypothetical protein K2L88_01700 [Clostridiales bacterium]|nr:hypothetical protein [Clostridiales bacterium]
MTNLKRKAFANILLSFLYLGTAVVGYIGHFDKCVEMTFMSNAFTGSVLLLGGVYIIIFKRDIPHFLYLSCAVLMSSVIAACLLFAPPMLVVGTAIIPHLINPIVIFVYYFKTCDARGCRLWQVFTTLVFPTIYYVFMILFGIMGSHSVYPQFDPNIISVLNLTLVGVAALAGLFVVGAVLLKLNVKLRNAAEKRKGNEQVNV